MKIFHTFQNHMLDFKHYIFANKLSLYNIVAVHIYFTKEFVLM